VWVLFDIWRWSITQGPLPNIIQVSSGVAAGYALRKFNCKEKRCPRIGKHTVDGTTYKTCSKHATREVHDRLKARHAEERPEQHALLN
jgi:hypothetical protein